MRKIRPIKKKNRSLEKQRAEEKNGEEFVEYIRGIFFVPHTESSELAKRIREKLRSFEELSSIRVKLVERTGEKIVDILHKSNPWEATHCGREDCMYCGSRNEKLVGKCKKRNIVYETECLLCKGEMGEADGFEKIESEKDKGAEPKERNGMVILDGTGIKHGAVPLLDSMERIEERKDERREKRAEPQVMNGMVIMDGTGMNMGWYHKYIERKRMTRY